MCKRWIGDADLHSAQCMEIWWWCSPRCHRTTQTLRRDQLPSDVLRFSPRTTSSLHRTAVQWSLIAMQSVIIISFIKTLTVVILLHQHRRCHHHHHHLQLHHLLFFRSSSFCSSSSSVQTNLPECAHGVTKSRDVDSHVSGTPQARSHDQVTYTPLLCPERPAQ